MFVLPAPPVITSMALAVPLTATLTIVILAPVRIFAAPVIPASSFLALVVLLALVLIPVVIAVAVMAQPVIVATQVMTWLRVFVSPFVKVWTTAPVVAHLTIAAPAKVVTLLPMAHVVSVVKFRQAVASVVMVPLVIVVRRDISSMMILAVFAPIPLPVVQPVPVIPFVPAVSPATTKTAPLASLPLPLPTLPFPPPFTPGKPLSCLGLA
jgi:hypothetical protein